LNRCNFTYPMTSMLATLLLLVACGKSSTPPQKDAAPSKSATAQTPAANASHGSEKDSEKTGVTLTAEQIEKLGVTTEPAATAEYTEEAAGYGLIVNHESIAQAVSELETAKATARFSQSALTRAQHLAGTPGAVSADSEESIAQKAAVDGAALTLTTHRLSALFGMNPPWNRGEDSAMLERLASGHNKLLRATFPLGMLGGEGIPRNLRAQRLTAGKPAKDWRSTVVWEAPADSSVPGRSFFALLNSSDAQEGERLQVWAPVGSSLKGAAVPASAVVMSDGKFWCYVERGAGAFARVEIDTSRPVSGGYFVTDGIAAGDSIVSNTAGQLLAKELGAESESD
jgi:hypothetical protein